MAPFGAVFSRQSDLNWSHKLRNQLPRTIQLRSIKQELFAHLISILWPFCSEQQQFATTSWNEGWPGQEVRPFLVGLLRRLGDENIRFLLFIDLISLI